MMQIFDHTDLAALLALAIPVFALITAMMLAIRRISMRRKGGSTRVTGRYGAPLAKSKSRAPPPPPIAPEKVPQALQPEELLVRIKDTEKSPEDAALPALYLDLARLQIGSGSSSEAADHLRKCIRLAAKLGQNQTHAGARLELGDLARAEGDLTTACEHWQIARGLFHDLKREADLAAAEKRMQVNGCPTDWVLNDF